MCRGGAGWGGTLFPTPFLLLVRFFSSGMEKSIHPWRICLQQTTEYDTSKITHRRLYQDFGHIMTYSHICCLISGLAASPWNYEGFASVIFLGVSMSPLHQLFSRHVFLAMSTFPRCSYVSDRSQSPFGPLDVETAAVRGFLRRVHVKAVRARAIPLSVRTWRFKTFWEGRKQRPLLTLPETNIAA